MDINDAKTIVETFESFVKTIGILVGAIWVYTKFIRTRENHPKVEFDVDLRMLGRQDGKILIEVVANLENKGLVRHSVNKFTCDILILKSDDPVINGDKRINHQLLFEKCNPIKEDDKMSERIIWIPKSWYESFVDAGITQRYSYLTAVPEVTKFISIYSQFYYKNKDFQTAQRSFSVEELENKSNKDL